MATALPSVSAGNGALSCKGIWISILKCQTEQTTKGKTCMQTPRLSNLCYPSCCTAWYRSSGKPKQIELTQQCERCGQTRCDICDPLHLQRRPSRKNLRTSLDPRSVRESDGYRVKEREPKCTSKQNFRTPYFSDTASEGARLCQESYRHCRTFGAMRHAFIPSWRTNSFLGLFISLSWLTVRQNVPFGQWLPWSTPMKSFGNRLIFRKIWPTCHHGRSRSFCRVNFARKWRPGIFLEILEARYIHSFKKKKLILRKRHFQESWNFSKSARPLTAVPVQLPVPLASSEFLAKSAEQDVSLFPNLLFGKKNVVCGASARRSEEGSVSMTRGVLLALNAMLTSTRFVRNYHLHRWTIAGRSSLQCSSDMNQAPAPLCRKLKRTSHHRSTRGNNMSLHPFKPSSLSGILSFSNRSPILWNALQSVPNLCSLSLPKFKKVFTKLLLDSPKYISYAVGDVNRYTWCGSYINTKNYWK